MSGSGGCHRRAAGRDGRAARSTHKRLDLPASDFADDFHRIRAGDGDAQREDLVEDRAERVDVRASINPLDLPARLLRGHELRRAHDGAGQRSAE